MNKKYLLIAFFLLMLVLAACSSEETATPETTPIPTETQTPAPEPEELLPISAVSIDEVQNIVWMWSGLIETQPASQSVVPDPENYTLTLTPDNLYSAKADCNMTGGTYQVDGSFITLMPGPTTLAECGEESLYNQYISLLGSVATFGMREDILVLGLKDGAGEMQFVNGGSVPTEPTPDPETCNAGIDPATVKIDTEGLYQEYLAECVLMTDYDESQPPGPTGLPDNIQILFDPLETEELKPNEPIIYIIPVEDYIEMWNANGNDSVETSIQELKALLEEKPEPIPTSGIPILPFEEVIGVPDIQVQGKYLDIEMGEGIRFVSRFSQGPNPVTNDNPPLFYTFQGFSDDGVYLISFFNPVTTDALPSSGEVSDEEMNSVNEDIQTYLDAKTTELNNLTPSDWNPDLNTLDAMITSLKWGEDEPAPEPTDQLTNIKWLWTSLIETDPASQSAIPDPENYSVVFLTSGTLNFIADCNTGSGSYSISGNQISISIELSTQAQCPEGSLSTQFVTLLGEAATYRFDSGSLFLDLVDNTGTMGFINGGIVTDPTDPDSSIATATTTEPLNVRSGPSTDYYSYGIVPAGTTFEISGISESGGWWYVKVPASLNPEGTGWISGDYTVTENTENIPVIPNPPLITATPTGAATAAPTSDPNVTATVAPTNPLAGTSWTVASINGQAPVGGVNLTLGFDQSTLSGNGGCNSFNGGYTVNGNSIAIGALASTGSLCGDEIDQQEQTYLNLLQSADTFQFDGSQLVLYSSGSEVLRFN